MGEKKPLPSSHVSLIPIHLAAVVAVLVIIVTIIVEGVVVCEGTSEEKNGLYRLSKLEMFVDELPDMPKLQGFRFDAAGAPVAGNLTIGMYDTTWKFHRDLPPSRVFAYGTSRETATVPGPTIEALRGVPTHITWTNHLPSRHFLPWDPTITTASPRSGVPTVVHLHGGINPPSSDGNALAWFTSSLSSTGPHFSSPIYFYPNAQPPGNLWYHDHAMGLTRVNLLAGLIGAYHVSGPEEAALGLPSGHEFDRHIVLFDRAFRADGALYMNATGDNPAIHPQWQPEYFGPAVVANGKAWPFLRVRRRRYRLRILNASNARFFRLSLSNGLPFVHVSSDSVYLPRPEASRSFLLGPSEFADVVVDFARSTSDHVILRNDAPYPYPSGDPTDELSGRVMKFVIRRRRERQRDPSRVPRSLLHYPAAHVAESVRTRYITMYEYESATGDPTHLYLNAKSYGDPVTETPAEGTAEIWRVINLTDDNHPLHIHLAVFAVREQRELVDVEGFKECMMRANDAVRCRVGRHAVGRRRTVPPWERGWKNVFKMRPGFVTEILVRFKPLGGPEWMYPFDATAEPGYVYHCHILDHEDNEMMRPFKLVH
uniref:Plastocyanin-like domain-containing protein n=1 Tax=Ananas comosus var. bracteatus TaxID=296719 RepID=A0A6V7QHQ1_ANACO|nr:unnamed protein product [Ananas comosus var. bracteatus]